MLQDAREVNRADEAPTTAKTFTTPAPDEMAALTAMMASMQAELTALRADRGTGGTTRPGGALAAGRGQWHGRAAMEDRSRPPDSTQSWHWCDHHRSWTTSHSTETCLA